MARLFWHKISCRQTWGGKNLNLPALHVWVLEKGCLFSIVKKKIDRSEPRQTWKPAEFSDLPATAGTLIRFSSIFPLLIFHLPIQLPNSQNQCITSDLLRQFSMQTIHFVLFWKEICTGSSYIQSNCIFATSNHFNLSKWIRRKLFVK